MNIRITDPVVDFFNQQILENGKPVSYGNLIILSLMAQQQDTQLSTEEKLHRFSLAQRTANALLKNKDVEYDSIEIDLIKKSSEKVLTIYTFGKLNQLFGG